MDFENLSNYFIHPRVEIWDVPQTILFATTFVIAIFIIYLLLKKLKIRVDWRLALAVSPYVLFGGAIRVLQDAGIFDSYWLVTPGIYVLVFSITSAVLLISLLLERKKRIDYFKPTFVTGIILFSLPLSFLAISNPSALFDVIILYSPWIILLLVLIKKWNLSNRLVTLVQMFDATVTYVAVGRYGGVEKHVLPTFFIKTFSPVSFILLKFVSVVVVLILIDKLVKDKELNNYLKLIIGILGGATSSRDFIALLTLG